MLGNIKTFTNQIRFVFVCFKKSSAYQKYSRWKKLQKWMLSFKIIHAFKIPIWPNATDA